MKPPDDSTDMFWGKNATNLYRVPADKVVNDDSLQLKHGGNMKEVYRIPAKDVKTIDGVQYVTLKQAGEAFVTGVNTAIAQKLEELLEQKKYYIDAAIGDQIHQSEAVPVETIKQELANLTTKDKD